MLVTTCKHCGARFRVTPDQLNLRQGQVRCGECHEVFNGFESLERFPGDDTGAKLLAVRAAKATHADPVAGLADAEFGARVRPAPAAAPPAPPAGTAPATPPEAGLADIPDLSDVPDLEPESAPPAAEPPGAAPPREPASRMAIAPSIDAFVPEPPAPVSRAWSFGVVLLALVLGVQLAYYFRARLAQQYPVLRPPLEAACAAAGCTVPWVNDESALKLEDSELLEVPGRPGQIALQARIRNLSSAAQEFPYLELTLTDLTGQTAVRRVLRPTDYLGRAPAQDEVMAAGSEALLSVRLETGRIRPTGYELLLFYP